MTASESRWLRFTAASLLIIATLNCEAPVNGGEVHDPASFFDAVLVAFKATNDYRSPNHNFSSFKDWMVRLDWLGEEEDGWEPRYSGYCLALLNEEQIKESEPKQKADYLGTLRGIVYFWTQERRHAVNGAVNRDFTVFLVHGKATPPRPGQLLYSWLPPEYDTAKFPWEDAAGTRYIEPTE
jgi:hypothetical protein